MSASSSREASSVRADFRRLRAARRYAFPKAGRDLECPEHHGVYIITNRAGRVVHVGRTLRGRGGLRQRLRNHLAGKSSFVKGFLKGEGARLRRGYSYQWAVIRNSRRRALVEHYATGVLCPRHIGTGEAVAT